VEVIELSALKGGYVTATPEEEKRPLEGETVSVIAVWGGSELDAFRR